MLKVALVDDDPKATELLGEYIGRYGEENGKEFFVNKYTNGLELLDGSAQYDIVFLDIDMPECDGLRVARELRKTDKECVIIFVTNIARYAIEGYSVEALDFIVKPVDYASFSFRMGRAVTAAEKRTSAQITLIVKYGKRKVSINDIRYIEVIKHKLIYHTANGDFEVWDTMAHAREKLEPYGFCLCNVCYLVNLAAVTDFEGDTVTVGGDKLKISRLKKKDFMAALMRVMI